MTRWSKMSRLSTIWKFLMSYSKYAIPAIVMSRCANYNTYALPMDHRLSIVEQSTLWLAKPVGHLLNRIHGAKQRRAHTRSSLNDACLSQDLFICSAYVTANEFITVSDDIELIDLIDSHTSKKIWHCSSFEKSDMLSKAVGTLPGGYTRSAPLPRLRTGPAHCRPLKVGAHQSPMMSQRRTTNTATTSSW